jgi:uncharacterized membrane protein YeaQ/YmgE (transglycosylase-associated protein family)
LVKFATVSLPHLMLQRNKHFDVTVPFERDTHRGPPWHYGRRVRGSGRCIGHGFVERANSAGVMEAESIVVWLIIGAVAGWLAGTIAKGGGFGLIGDIVVGIIGAVIAGWLLPYLHINIGSGIVASIIDAVIGAVILLVVLRLVKRA